MESISVKQETNQGYPKLGMIRAYNCRVKPCW
uniref:Uncharacterized protein n=1 Tax=Arundo donax TaxID=35708 RepID=A0A0A9GPN8_ARUDO